MSRGKRKNSQSEFDAVSTHEKFFLFHPAKPFKTFCVYNLISFVSVSMVLGIHKAHFDSQRSRNFIYGASNAVYEYKQTSNESNIESCNDYELIFFSCGFSFKFASSCLIFHKGFY